MRGPELTFINPGGVVCVGDGMQVSADHVMSSPVTSHQSPLVTKLRKPAPMVTPPAACCTDSRSLTCTFANFCINRMCAAMSRGGANIVRGEESRQDRQVRHHYRYCIESLLVSILVYSLLMHQWIWSKPIRGTHPALNMEAII